MFSYPKIREREFIPVDDLANEVLLSRMGPASPVKTDYSADEVLDVVGNSKIDLLSKLDLSDSEREDESSSVVSS